MSIEFKKEEKKAQVWIDTVMYTLIAFVLIGAVLAFAKPKIEEMQDKAVIEQSIGLMKDIDSTVMEIVQGGSGNKRILETLIKKGNLIIDAINDTLLFEIKGKYLYSEPKKEIIDGNLIIVTKERGDLKIVTITRIYDEYNITFNNKDANKIISKASTPYKLSLTNRGKDDSDKWQVDIEIT